MAKPNYRCATGESSEKVSGTQTKLEQKKTMLCCYWHSERPQSTCFLPHRKHCNNGRPVLSLRKGFVNVNSPLFRPDLKRFSVCYILSMLCMFSSVTSQDIDANARTFPPLFNAAQNRPILTEPSQSTCGTDLRTAYCKSSIYPISIDPMCTNQDFCVQTCPGRTKLPTFISLLPATGGFSDCVIADTINIHPGSAVGSYSTSFISSGSTCFLTPLGLPSFKDSLEFTITVWLWLREPHGTLIQKLSQTNGEIIFELNVRQAQLNFLYNSTFGVLTVTVPYVIPLQTWTHIAVQTYGTNVSFYFNGPGSGFTASHTVTLMSPIQEHSSTWVRVGLTFSGTYPFLGRIQDFRFYRYTLSNREIAEDYSGTLPEVRVQTTCRCPASHPRVKPLFIHYCIRNGAPDNTNDDFLRLNSEAHPLEYVNDGDSNSIWISRFFEEVNLIVDLGDQYQVFYVVVQFYSPLPKAVEIQRMKDDGTSWETWQQYAEDCPTYYNTANNGPLPSSTSVNCLQFTPSQTQYSKGNITFNILNPEPVPRPGYNDFYNTEDLYNFVISRKVRVKMQEHYYVINDRHKYYGLYEYIVIARCDCHGHAETCDHTTLPYQCHCLISSYTQGRLCDRCQALYNDKQFRRGDLTNAYDCKPCECYSHADECVYNRTLDPFPDDHYAGGGGVCVNCTDNTEGQFCDMCIDGFFRPQGKSKYDADVCSDCACLSEGVKDENLICEKVDGQCLCKEYVTGRQCEMCKAGYFNLTLNNTQGCIDCGCDLRGTLNRDVSCLPTTGVCTCKQNVRNDKCDACQYGFFNLTDTNTDGCTACNCNPFGSTNQYCDPDTGQCLCKPNIMSQHCDHCADGFYSFEEGCLPCDCNPRGSFANQFCDKRTGQCPCKINVQGLLCDTCKDETFGFGLSPTDGCVVCNCNSAGTINGSSLCMKQTGNCLCKDNVEGATCNLCKGNTWGLNISNPLGCGPCRCDITGTQGGQNSSASDLSCHQNTGQCSCLPNREGRQCDDCSTGYYVSSDPEGGCLVCNCHPFGTAPLTQCDTQTGQCECRGGDSGVTGISCDGCREDFYGFNGLTGICKDCDCAVAGSVNTSCDVSSGMCNCKEFTQNRRCDRCVKGTAFLEPSNPYGCSKAPAQQPPPTHMPLSPSALRLTWSRPDYPNGVIEQYIVFRNDTLIYTLTEDVRTFDDTGLTPFTRYSYVIMAKNAFGETLSAPVVFQTPSGAPVGTINLVVTNIQTKSAQFNWNPPQIMNGPLERYILNSTTLRNSTPEEHWQGTELQVTLTQLIPFTNYTFRVDACTTGGCLSSVPANFITLSSDPEGMNAPMVTPVNNTALFIEWEPPDYPNGIIIFYELWMRGPLQSDGTRKPPEVRIFHPSGQYNPNPTQEDMENALPPPATNYTRGGLIPFTVYEFQVLAENDAGKAASQWVSGRTGATTPLSTPAPAIYSLSSSTLNVTWTQPSDDQSRGVIVLYHVFLYAKTNLTLNPFAPPYSWELLYNATGDRLYYVLQGLSPYSEYTLKVGACNSVGCVNSTETIGRTDQAVPEGLKRPIADGFNSSAMEIEWMEPAFPNGPAPHYKLQKTIPALSFPPQVIRGTRFPGGGYYLFPPTTIPPNVAFTGIQFLFRTRQRDGLLMFAGSEGRQEEFIALQFKAGRPWFLFDPQGCLTTVPLDASDDRVKLFDDGEWHHIIVTRNGSRGEIVIDNIYKGGCASFVTPTNDEGLPYNDNTWHQMMAWRDETVAYISIDGQWKGSRQSSCSRGTIIGPNTGVYIGGLPVDFDIRRRSSDSRLQLIHHSFQGCIRDIQIMQQKYPVEVWKTLDWNNAIANELAFLNWEGCPINLDKGVHFMGQGYARFPADLVSVNNNLLIQFGFRTQMHTGILFFAHGGKGIYIFCALINGALHFEFSNGISPGMATFKRSDVNFCDSRWYNVELTKTGQMANITVSNIGVEVSGSSAITLNVVTLSEFYIGGIPPNTEAYDFVVNNKLSLPLHAFGGCLRDITINLFKQLNFLTETVEVQNINMDGCTPYHVHSDTCKDDFITDVYNGTDTHVFDIGLQPYSNYLYRVMAINDAGAGTSPWGYGRTKEGAPIGVSAPYDARILSGFKVEVKWLAPVSTAGLLTKFILSAYNLANISIPPLETTITNTSKRIGNITELTPHVTYSIKLSACTGGGCAESPDGLVLTTKEEAPQDVRAPTAVSTSYYMLVSWEDPGKPNGIIIGFFLYRDKILIYTGGQRLFNITEDLQVYTSYVFYVRACTKIGCTVGPNATLSTSQLPPTHVDPPTLIVLGTYQMQVLWAMPDQLNGVLLNFALYRSTDSSLLGDIAYNSSDYFLDYVMSDLTAGTEYFISLAACTGGGCRVSNSSNATTAESAPEGIPAPVVSSPSWSELTVTWGPPTLPNGILTEYKLYHNEIPVYSGMEMEYSVRDLMPYSLHYFRIAACTKQGCGSSTLIQARTREAAPVGFITMEMTVDDSRTISVKWTRPIQPNGDMFFDVYLDGIFYVDPENWDYNIIYARRSLYHGQDENVIQVISPLIPMSSYEVQVNASNTVGFILSNSMIADMPPGSPDGVRPPTLISATPTTITVSWVPVGRKNTLDDPMYTLQFRDEPGVIIQDIFGPSAAFTFTLENLLAFTSYQFRLVATNSQGSTNSIWVSKVTMQDKPAGFAPPVVVGTGSRYIDLVWTAPVTMNGVLVEYKVYQNGQYRESTDGNTTTLRADGLNPFTYFTFVLEACTEGGCTRSSPSVATRTLQDLPQIVRPPALQSLTPSSVEIRWSEPGMPNGVISLYEVQRRLPSGDAVTSLVTLSATMNKVYVDEDMILTPFTEYEYRLIVTNGAGQGTSDWASVVTMSSRPAGIMAPVVTIVGPEVLSVSWSLPLQPNGVVEFYTIRLPEPQVQVRNTSIMTVVFEDLVPYTEYSVTVTACTDGGCTESPPVLVRTHATVPEGQTPPIATPVSQFLISVLWQGPTRPNGPNIRFELSRLKIRQPLNPSVNMSGLWESVYESTDRFYEDRGLPMYTTYRYRTTVYNDVGQLTSDPTEEVTTFGGFPRMAAMVTAEAINHLIVQVLWTPPDEVQLQGAVDVYTIRLMSSLRNYTQTKGPDVNTTMFDNLTPNTLYRVTVTITINGGATITNEAVEVTTLDGAPEGVDKPTLTIVSETALRVSWMAPTKPNGQITGYNIIINEDKIETGLTLPGSYVINELQPYTVYTIQVEVCTVFTCVSSEPTLGTTAETLPYGVTSPRLIPLSSYDVSVMWDRPVQPNGIILRYDLWRTTIKQCSEIPKVTMSPERTKCTYMQCSVLQNLCGSTCYSGPRVCCDGVLYDSKEDYECCGNNYMLKSLADDVCCSGMFYRRQVNYQCCKDRYELVMPGQVCCPDNSEDRVAVGTGNSCCGTIPYSTFGAQMCCNGVLYDHYNSQCCGGAVVSEELVCCGGDTSGNAYTHKPGMSCCDKEYVQDDQSICCTSDTGHIKAHVFESVEAKLTANVKCCGLEVISKGLSCCNDVGYNTLTHVCADISHQEAGCGSGTVCSRSQETTAFCDRCDFDPVTYICGSIRGHYTTEVTPAPPNPFDDCVVSEERIYSGMVRDYADGSLIPYSLYEYAVSAVNSAGTTKSSYTSITTLQARPEGLAPPVTTINPKQLYVIHLSWVPPAQPNGEILRFILSRDGIELYRGLGLQYTDDTTILPYRSYSYIVTACTVAGCISSPHVTVATAQGIPEDILPPRLTVLNETALHVTWTPPAKPNGIITVYQLYFAVEGKQMTVRNTTELSVIMTDLLPYVRYNASLRVCTEVGCTGSDNTTIRMPEAAPEGVSPPTVIIISSTSVDVYWVPPTKPNGQILFYSLLRSEQNVGLRVFLNEEFHTRDINLTPGTTYLYFILMGTSAGNTSSNATSVQMPDNTPPNIPAPKNITVLNATQIYVQWDPIPPSEAAIDQYRVLLNAGRQNQIDYGVGVANSATVDSLIAFTEYEVRIQACLQGVPNGCGTGQGVVVKTFEASPTGMLKPKVFARGPDIVDVTWETPLFPNGIITRYSVYYRKYGTLPELLINRVDGETFTVRHAGQELIAFTEYEYKVLAENQKGDVASPWTKIRTFEDIPSSLPQPVVTVKGAYSIILKWIPPLRPNGIIQQYKVIYRQTNVDPTVPGNTAVLYVSGNLTQTSISGLKPFSEYILQMQAFNNVGNVTSIWSTFKTGEASPAGLSQFTIEKISTGQSVILRWGPPNEPNGVVTMYRIFEEGSSVAVFQGLNREFELRRLQPYTTYSVQLEACTAAGCARSFSQSFTTSEVSPSDLASPVMGEVTSGSIFISWSKPIMANGRITMYQVYRRTNRRIQKRSLSDPVVIYRLTNIDPDADTYTYNDTNVQPYTEYQYSVAASNSRGSTHSPWQTAFTDQAPPEGVQPPSVQYILDSVDSLLITWSDPDRPNGILQSYQIKRNDSVPFSFAVTDQKQFTDIKLLAYTFYSYTLTVCSGGGCSASDPTVIRTKETSPLKVNPPTLFAENSTALRITWQKPQITTGEIIAYQLHMNGIVIYEGLQMSFTTVNLIPFTDYTFKLTACTNGGCSDSGEVTGRPEDDKPENMLPPILRVMSSSSIEISWKEPEFPNGVITSYDVRRNGRLIYTESISVTGSLRTAYTDYNLSPGTEYAYIVIARNRRGSVESPPSMARTFASSPSGLDPPKLSPVSATSIQVTWDPPASPNGVLKNYTLFRDGSIAYSGSPSQLSYTVPGLNFWTEYTFRIQACTDRGCELSTSTTARTLAARPEQIAPPALLSLANQNGGHNGVLIEWTAPLKPNGVIQSYKVYRRQLIQELSGISYGETAMVYTGPELTYTDRDSKLLPFTDYQYSVTAINIVGEVSSLWAVVTTKEAPPAGLSAPIIVGTTPSTIIVRIAPPITPNGVIRYYNVLVNGTVGSSSIDLLQTVGQTVSLLPFRYYSLTIQACTAGGCTTSPANVAQTGSAKPSGQEPLSVLDLNSTAVKLTWSHPTNPNGVITRFILYQRTACPPTSQPFLQSCTVGDAQKVYEGLYIEKVVGALLPYTAYQFQVQSANVAGVIDFPLWVRTETSASGPQYIQFPRLIKNDSRAIFDWSGSFILNSRLKEYMVMSEGNVLFRGVTSRHEMARPSRNSKIIFKIVVVTETGQIESPVIVFDPNAVGNIGETTIAPGSQGNQTQQPKFYEEVWFIVLMVLLGVLLILIIVGFCVRRAHGRHPYIRERLPLRNGQKKREPYTFCVDANDGSIFAMNGLAPNQDDPKFYPDAAHNGVVNPAFANGNIHVKKRGSIDKDSAGSFFDDGDDMIDDVDFLWEKNQDSGLVSTFDGDTDSRTAPSYSITKEQTVFTDTHL